MHAKLTRNLRSCTVIFKLCHSTVSHKANYHIDGQFLDEDYEYGSFTQSKMYMKDVRCGDCHDPHSLKRKFEGNAVCTQCHRADEYDTFDHHLHKSKGETGTSFINKQGEKLGPGDGNLCRDCHMPGRYYMGVDRRYDHSMRIPRPDLSIQLGTPNACTHCHDDKTDQWALQYVNKWYGEKKKPHYATILADGAAGKTGADSGLLKSSTATSTLKSSGQQPLAICQHTRVQRHRMLAQSAE